MSAGPSLAWMMAAAIAVAVAARADEPAAAAADTALAAAVANSARSARFVARDAVRHPFQELSFLGVTPTATVVEVWPGAGYWTEILAPYLRDHGQLIEALPEHGDDKAAAAFRAWLAADPARYGRVKLVTLGDGRRDIAPPCTADIVLTFRNLHDWMQDGTADTVLEAFFRVLKPGGILGIEDHRARTDRPQDPAAQSGYVRQDYAVALANSVGFALEASSEMNANPRDTTEWPQGVWTLPPTFRLGQADRAKYAAIGEADNFVLRFRKPDL